MDSYIKILREIQCNGQIKKNRTGIDALTVIDVDWKHDMSLGFPLLTIRKMPVKAMWKELEGFIKGVSHKEFYQVGKTNFWKWWANPREVKNKIHNLGQNVDSDTIKQLQIEERDLGPIYGYQWRRFGQAYDCDDNAPTRGFDQLKEIVRLLKEDPNNRRMVCSAWNPNHFGRMALEPCHILWSVGHLNGKLSLSWFQRSCDALRGIPNNIASYATLLLLLCKEANMEPGTLSAKFFDCHLYVNQLNAARDLITRKPRKLPSLKIDNFTNIFEWDSKDCSLINYNYDDTKIDFGEIAV